MATATSGISIEEFEALPAALAVGHELVNGKLVPVASNKRKHIRVSDWLFFKLFSFVKDAALGEVMKEQEFEFGQNAHAPDIAFVSMHKRHLLDDERRVQLFQPDLAIELVSDNDKFEDLMGKAARYRRSGVPEVWVFSIGLRKTFLLSEKGDAILGDDAEFRPAAISGFAMRIGDIFDLKG